MRQVQRSLVTMFLVLAFGAAAVAAAYLATQRRSARETAAGERKRPLELQPDSVVRLTIVRDGQQIAIERADERWRITAPVRDLADDSAIDSMLNSAAGLTLTKVFDGNDAPDAAALQLAPPRSELLFATASGTVGIHLGRRNPFDGRIYVRAGAQPALAPIGMLDGPAAAALDKDLAGLRDRRLLPMATHDAMALEVRFASATNRAISFAALRAVGGPAKSRERGDGARPQWDDPWTLSAPLAGPADADTISQLLQQLGGARYERVVSEEPTVSLSHYGLDPAGIVVAVKSAAGERTLRIGTVAAPGGARHFAQRSGLSAIVEVSQALIEGLGKTHFDLEEKRALTFSRDQVRQLKLQLADGKLAVLERERGDADVERWSLLAPHPGPTKSWRVSSLLFALTNIKAKRYAATGLDAKVEPARLAAYGLDRPRQTFVAFDDDQRELGALLVGSASGEETFVMRRGGDRVLVVARGSVDELPQTLDDLTEEPGAGGDR